MNLKINRLQHVGIPVTDLARSITFYESLGFKNAMQTQFDYQNAKGEVAMLQMGDIVMELYQMPEPELSQVKLRKNGIIDHVCFDVDEIDETFNTLKEAGYDLIETEPVFLQFWEKGCKYFYILGPDKERLEFCEIIK